MVCRHKPKEYFIGRYFAFCGEPGLLGPGASFALLPEGCSTAGNGIRQLCAMEAEPEWHSAVRVTGGRRDSGRRRLHVTAKKAVDILFLAVA